MGGSAEKQRKKARAANAQLAREAKRANTSSNSTPEESQPVASCQNLSLVLLSGGKAPRLSEVHCDRDSVCVKTYTRRSLMRISV